MIINKYKIILTDRYVSGFYITEGEYDYEGQMANYPNVCDGYTKFENGQFIIDEDKKAEVIAQKQKEERIAELKAYLDSTDYIYAKCTETGEDVNVIYADVVEQRKSARKEIQELG